MIAWTKAPWTTRSQTIPSRDGAGSGPAGPQTLARSARSTWLPAALVVAALLVVAAPPAQAVGPRGTEARPAPLASTATRVDGLVRFHVVAHSDRAADQALKRSVRDTLLARYGEEMASLRDEAALEAWIASHGKAVQDLADGVLAEAGAPYGSRLVLGWADFPETRFGPMVFPAGRYRALQLILGDGAGHNWWCVVFPPLCVVDETAVSRLEARPADAALPAFSTVGAAAVSTSTGHPAEPDRVEWRWRFLEGTEPGGTPARLARWWEDARRLVAQGAARLLWQPAHAGAPGDAGAPDP
ncbi:stage II sporulation protein R [Limnochorda pilosa]|nr:stage II sporulation protein R [Limnochorda pilosa]